MKDLSLFYSYCHLDEEYRLELEKWLSTLRREGLIKEWYDRKVTAGQKFAREIKDRLRSSDIALLLLSQNFLASEACVEEMSFALKHLHRDRIIPIILKSCAWKETECKDLLALPTDGKPVASWPTQEDAWLSVFRGIKESVSRLLRTFEIKDVFSEEIDKVEFVRQSKRQVLLRDIFVFPIATIEKTAESRETVQHGYFAAAENKAILVLGEELSGKSALIRYLFADLRSEYSTILIDGERIFKTVKFDDLLRKEFDQQMTGSFDEWMKSPKKCVLVDDFNHRVSRKALNYFAQNFEKCVVTMNTNEYLVYFKDDPLFAAFSPVTLRPLSLSRQEDLVRKWLCLSDSDSSMVEVDYLAIDKVEEKINAIVAANQIVPRYPFYVLSILQSLEAFMPKDYSITAYGHCYHALATAQLIRKGIGGDEIDSCFNYLTELAREIYQTREQQRQFGATEYDLFKQRYLKQFFIQDRIVNRIEARDYPLLALEKELINFEYPYLYYFFLGRYIAAKGTDSQIDTLCSNIHLKENAFIIIFAVHHAQNRSLIDTILLHSICQFDNINPATLDTAETKFMNDLMITLPKSIISERTVSDNRKKLRDSIEEIESEEETDGQEDSDLIQVSRGMKIIEVLGQILKNRAGSFDKPAVIEMLENAIDLGLRIMNMFLGDFRKPEFAEWLRSRLEEAEIEYAAKEKRKYDEARKLRFAEKTIQLFGHIISIGMLSKITHSISSEKLLDAISLICQRRETPAYKLIFHRIQLSQTGIDIDGLKKLLVEFDKSKNFWARKMLSFYVQSYLNTHKVEPRKKQQAFELLGLYGPAIDLSHLTNR